MFCLIYSPYSPDLSAYDFGDFVSLKKFLVGQYFSSDEKVKMAIKKWMLQVG